MKTLEEKIEIISIIQTFSGFFSLFGSLSILSILLRIEGKLCSTYRRLVFGMSMSDALASAAFVLCAVPTIGESACSIQGFFVHIGVLTTPSYNFALCVYYLLTVRFERNEIWVQKRVEPILHFLALSWPIGTGIFLLVTKNFNPTGPNCWIGPSPRNCLIDPNIECERGQNSYKYRWWFAGYQVIFIFVFIVISMIFLCTGILRREQRLSMIGSRQIQSEDNKEEKDDSSLENTSIDDPALHSMELSSASKKILKKQLVTQALIYAAAYLVPAIFPLVFNVTLTKTGQRNFVLWVFVGIFMPMQGFFNFFVYIRPRVLALRNSNFDISLWKAIILTVKAEEPQRNEHVPNAQEIEVL